MHKSMLAVMTVCLSLGFGFLNSAGAADVTVSAADWQKQSLKGVTTIKYGVVDFSKNGLIDALTDALKSLKVQTKHIDDLKADATTPLTVNEARLKLVAQDRENNQSWVGISLEQRCQLKRTPSINLDAETYKIGRLCPRDKVKETAKDLCSQFVKDWSSSTK